MDKKVYPAFDQLEDTVGPLRAVRRFLRQAGRLDTLKHVAQVNAAAREYLGPV